MSRNAVRTGSAPAMMPEGAREFSGGLLKCTVFGIYNTTVMEIVNQSRKSKTFTQARKLYTYECIGQYQKVIHV